VPQTLYPIVLPTIAKDATAKVLPEERHRYRTTREAVLARWPFLNGETPGYSDYILGALFL